MKTLKSFLALTCICGLTALAAQTSLGSLVIIAPPDPPVLPTAPPSNISLTNFIGGVSNVLWDVSRLTNELQQMDMELPTGNSSSVRIIYADPMAQNGRGKLSGSGTNTDVTVIENDNGGSTNTFKGKYTTTGSITSAKGVAHLVFSSRVTGQMLFPGDTKPRTVSASAVYNVKVYAVSNLVSGSAVLHASASGKGSASQREAIGPDTLADLITEMGSGTWTLELHFGAANGNKLTGTADVILSSGQVYPFTLVGVYNPKNNQSKLNLKGNNAGLGSNLQVTLDGTDIIKITGQVSGQLVNIK